MAGAFASKAINWALGTLSSLLPVGLLASQPRLAPADNSKQGLEDLRRIDRVMRRIRATLQDAEDNWNMREETAKLWLRELKNLAYAMEDVVSEYEYEVTLCRAEALEKSAGLEGKRQEGQSNACMEATAVPVPTKLAARARKIIERFNEIKDDYDKLHLSENDGERRPAINFHSTRQTGYMVAEQRILGREQDKEIIITKLLSEGINASPVSVLPIVGMGGVGKTALAQYIYNDSRVHEVFPNRAWVYVSEHFDVSNITNSIITSLTRAKCDLTELAHLQGKLMDEVNNKRLLLVLDDVWNVQRHWWDIFLKQLATTLFCSIIVTTRMETVAELVQTMPFHRLGLLSPKDSWSLFQQDAFPGLEKDHKSNIEMIGKKIVEKCGGLPLAIRTLASMLQCEVNDERWKDVLESGIWDMDVPQIEFLPALELSFKNMHTHLKHCFISLSLFPKDCRLNEKEVISLWKSLDLLQHDGRVDEDQTGRLYLNELVQRSILQCNGPEYATEDGFTMHAITHDYARYVAGDEFLILEAGTAVEISSNVRYMSLVLQTCSTIEISPFLNASESLRALIVMAHKYATIEIPEELFLNFKHLRVFIVYGSDLNNELPDSVGNMKYLRHLRVSGRGTPTLPTSMLQLFNLRTLDLRDTRDLNYTVIPSGIGRMVNLQNLPEITIGRCTCLPKLIELSNLYSLRGELCIQGLGNVYSIEDGRKVNLQTRRLQALSLVFNSKYCAQCEHIQQNESVAASHGALLQSLQPQYNIKRLEIHDCRSSKCPSWLGDASYSMLSHIYLGECEFEHMPPLGQLPSLKSLVVNTMVSVTLIGQEFFSFDSSVKVFRSLECLTFSNMPRWMDWYCMEDTKISLLHTICIHNSPRLRSLPLSLSWSPLVSCELTHCCDLVTIPAFSTLCELHIKSCDSLTELPPLPSLRKLHVEYCASLRKLHSLLLLQELQLKFCTSLFELPSLLSLEKLEVDRCGSLVVLGHLPSLTTTCLDGIPLGAFLNPPPPASIRLCCPKVQDFIEHITTQCDEEHSSTSLEKIEAGINFPLSKKPSLEPRLWGCPEIDNRNYLPCHLRIMLWSQDICEEPAVHEYLDYNYYWTDGFAGDERNGL